MGRVGFGGTRVDGRTARVLGVLAILGLSLLLAPAADASPMSFTWSGQSTITEDWSASANWVGGVEPTTGEAIGTLTFPRLTNEVCEEDLGTEPCYISYNNVSGLSAESVQIDDANDYLIGGNEIAIGSEGLTASPGVSQEAGTFIEMPLNLSATQTWHISSGGGELGENGLLLAGDLTGSGSGLTAELSNGPLLYLYENNTEVGPVTIAGADTGEVAANGIVSLLGAKLNSSDGGPVELSHVFFAGSGAVGPLTTDSADLDVGSPAADLEVTSAKLDAASHVEFNVVGDGMTAQTDYSQLLSRGPIELASSKVEVVVRPPKEGKPCPVLAPGQTYTFVSTTGDLSGVFANAPEHGAEIPIRFAVACQQISQKLQIKYHETGGTETVTGTVEEAAATKKQEEEAAAKKKHEEEEAKKREEEAASKKSIEEGATREANEAPRLEEEREAKAREEAERPAKEAAASAAKEREIREAGERAGQEAAAKKKEEEENAPTGSVLLNGSSITVQNSGEAAVKLACAGTTKCAGKLKLTIEGATKKGKKTKTETIGTSTFSIPPNETTPIKITLNAAGKALLSADHGRLGATLSILKSSPAPSQTHTDSIHLVQQKAHGKTKK
jgi:hypothetical protein